jgi:hypothetical protein
VSTGVIPTDDGIRVEVTLAASKSCWTEFSRDPSSSALVEADDAAAAVVVRLRPKCEQ